MTTITEADVEHAVLDWLSGLGWRVAHEPDIAPGGAAGYTATEAGVGGGAGMTLPGPIC